MKKSLSIIIIVLISCALAVSVFEKANAQIISQGDGNQAAPAESKCLDSKFFKEMINLSKDELISRLGENYIEGTLAIEKSHIILPCLFYRDLGLTFVLGGGEVRYINVGTEINIRGIAINKRGMNFDEIRAKLGEAEVNETWKATRLIKSYEIHYVDDGLKYTFLSLYKDGRATELIISEDW